MLLKNKNPNTLKHIKSEIFPSPILEMNEHCLPLEYILPDLLSCRWQHINDCTLVGVSNQLELYFCNVLLKLH